MTFGVTSSNFNVALSSLPIMIYRFYVVVLCVIAFFALALYLSGCDTVSETAHLDEARLKVHKQAKFTELALQPKADWSKADSHIAAVVASINAIDEGIAHCDYVISHSRVFSLLSEMHKARAEYLEARASLLYHLYNLAPVDVYKGVLPRGLVE